MPQISGLYVYPVKSCRGIALAEATLDARGIEHDRQFLIVDENDRFLTQRAVAELALIGTELTATGLVLTHARAGATTVDYHVAGRPKRDVIIWKDSVAAEDCGNEAAAWLSHVLARKCRLVTLGPASVRQREDVRAPDRARVKSTAPIPLAFPDGYPLLALSEESLAELNRQLDLPAALPLDRFRPNIVLSGCAHAHAEDTWKGFAAGTARFQSAGTCERCIVTTTDQQTLERGHEPLRTLARYHRACDDAVVFGQNLIITSEGGHLRVGDIVEIDA